MLAAAFFVTIVVALLAHHVLIERPRRARLLQVERRVRAGPTPLADSVGPVPGGVFLQNGFTWSRVVPDGGVEVGVHPMLVGLVGSGAEMSLHDPGGRVERGAPFLRIGAGNRELHLRAPVTGRITASNRYPRTDAGWDDPQGAGEAWLYRVTPDDLARDVPSWMIGTQATEWTRDRYERIREHLQHAVTAGETGLALADGGEVPFGALEELDPDAWLTFEQTFLAN